MNVVLAGQAITAKLFENIMEYPHYNIKKNSLNYKMLYLISLFLTFFLKITVHENFYTMPAPAEPISFFLSIQKQLLFAG